MSLEPTRRSARQSITTERAKQHIDQRNTARPSVPSAKDEIAVRWVLNRTVVWWPATVLSVQTSSSRSCEFRGNLLYHKLFNYSMESASVIFSISSSKERLVRTVGEAGKPTTSSQSSWVYDDEVQSDDDDKVSEDMSQHSSTTDIHSPSKVRCNAEVDEVRNGNLSVTAARVARNQVRRTPGRLKDHSVISKPLHSNRPSKEKRLSSSAQNGQASHAMSASDVLSSDANGTHDMELVSNESNHQTMLKEKPEIEVRISLLERHILLLNSSTGVTSTLSSSANSVVDSIRWAFLRTLEKPLKNSSNVTLSELSEHGIASSEMNVTAQCDYFTFKDIAGSLAKEHGCLSEQPKYKRVVFSPSFPTTQSGSSAVNDMSIVFSCLADLASFLRVRDDSDYDAILSKEVVTEASTLLRIIGTCIIDRNEGIGNAVELSTNSISASSEVDTIIRLFVGSSPVKIFGRSKIEAKGDEEQSIFQSTVLQQDCKHFCSTQKCYRSPWKTKDICSDFAVSFECDLDGVIPKEQLQNYFILNWSRQVAPSYLKWTRDVHETGNNCPGVLRLKVPFVFCNSSRNVHSLVSILDNHIETFMKLRSKIHNLSSFK